MTYARVQFSLHSTGSQWLQEPRENHSIIILSSKTLSDESHYRSTLSHKILGHKLRDAKIADNTQASSTCLASQ